MGNSSVHANNGYVLIYARREDLGRHSARTGEGDAISGNVQKQVALLKGNSL